MWCVLWAVLLGTCLGGVEKVMMDGGTIHGEATFYGAGSDSGGICTLRNPSPSQQAGMVTVALNKPDLNNAESNPARMCGACIEYRGNNKGSGTTPIPTTWTKAFVNNVCPECKHGDLDLALGGDGRWEVEWRIIPCPVDDEIQLHTKGHEINKSWMMLMVKNSKLPIESLQVLSTSGSWTKASREPFGFWAMPSSVYPLTNCLDVKFVSIDGTTITTSFNPLSGTTESAGVQFKVAGSSYGQHSGPSCSGATPPSPTPPSPSPPSPSPPSPSPPSADCPSTCADCGSFAKYRDNEIPCSTNPTCCPSGSTCYEKNQWWSGCKASCDPSEVDPYDGETWSCNDLGGGSPPPPPGPPPPPVPPGTCSQSGAYTCPLGHHKKSGTDLNYGSALAMSFRFYHAQRGGEAPSDVAWRGKCYPSDGGKAGLEGGWFDAGDYVKFGFPMAYSATALAWGGLEFTKGYKNSGQLGSLVEELDFVMDYFLAAWDSDRKELVVQIGNGHADHSSWAPCHKRSENRPVYSIKVGCAGADVAGETAAAFAATALLFKETGEKAAGRVAELQAAAESLYAFAKANPGTYHSCVTDASTFYKSWSGYKDELGWAAIWLYKLTEKASYLSDAKMYRENPNTAGTLSWDDKKVGLDLLLWEATCESKYQDTVKATNKYWRNSVPKSSGGLRVYSPWGSARYASSAAFVSLVYGRRADDADALEFGASQINYLLGDNPIGQSYLIGYGDKYPLNPHHRSAHASTGSGPSSSPQTSCHLLVGALVGGPTKADDNDWKDDRGDYQRNEVTTDYNALFSGALAAMMECTSGGANDICASKKCNGGMCTSNGMNEGVCVQSCNSGAPSPPPPTPTPPTPTPPTPTPPTPSPPTPSPPTPTPPSPPTATCPAKCTDCGSFAKYRDHEISCTNNPDCCPSGEVCYEKNQWWSGCKSSCDPNTEDPYDGLKWSCKKIGGTTPPAPTPTPPAPTPNPPPTPPTSGGCSWKCPSCKKNGGSNGWWVAVDIAADDLKDIVSAEIQGEKLTKQSWGFTWSYSGKVGPLKTRVEVKLTHKDGSCDIFSWTQSGGAADDASSKSGASSGGSAAGFALVGIGCFVGGVLVATVAAFIVLNKKKAARRPSNFVEMQEDAVSSPYVESL